MLAIANDIDQMSAVRFRQLHRFLNTKDETPMGPGLGLDVADSFWFYGLDRRAEHEDASDFTYFRGLTWAETSPYADELLHYIRSGWIDTIHSYGNFSGVPSEEWCTRAHAEHALSVLDEHDARVRVWTNHGSVQNVQNIGRPAYMEGDRPGSNCYHWDLLRQSGVEFLWSGDGAGQFKSSNPLLPLSLEDGTRAWGFRRFYSTTYAEAFEHGLQPSVAAQLRGGGGRAVLWHPQHFHVQLSDLRLQELCASGGFAILAQHFGATPQDLNLGGPAIAALRRLAEEQERGGILVARLSRLLDYGRALEFARFAVSTDEDDVTLIDVLGIDDPIFGALEPTVDRLRGLTFYVPDAQRTRISLAGAPLDEALVQRNPSDSVAPSVGIRWHQPDHVDHAAQFAEEGRSRHGSGALTPEAAGEKACAILGEEQTAEPPAGVASAAYSYAVKYSVERYKRLASTAKRFDDLGFSGAERGLDIGSGAGHWCTAFLLGNTSVAGIDSRPEFVYLSTRVAEGLGFFDRVDYRTERAEKLPFEDASFDVAWTHSVLQYTEPELTLREAARVLQPGAFLYCAYSSFGFRLSATYHALAKDDAKGADSQLRALLGSRRYRYGINSSPWSRIRAPSLDDAIAIADAAGMRFVDQPQMQEDQRSFLGIPETVDFLARKTPKPSDLAAELSEAGPETDDLVESLTRFVDAGSPRAVVDLLQARRELQQDPALRHVLLAAMVKSGLAKGRVADSLYRTEADAMLKGKLREELGDFAGAYELYPEAGGGAAAFLAGGCLLALDRPAEAAQRFTEGLDSDDPDLQIDCRIGLCKAAVDLEGIEGLKREFARLVEWLGDAYGHDNEARDLVAGLRPSA